MPRGQPASIWMRCLRDDKKFFTFPFKKDFCVYVYERDEGWVGGACTSHSTSAEVKGQP